jgi:hypothetical protein
MQISVAYLMQRFSNFNLGHSTKSEPYCTDLAVHHVESSSREPLPFNPRSPQQQGSTGQSKDDPAR